MKNQSNVNKQKTKIFNLIKSKEAARLLAMFIISITIVLETVEYFVDLRHGFTYERLFPYVFDMIANIFIVGTLIAKKIALIEVALIVLKVFDGTYYPFVSAQRLDALLMTQHYTVESITYYVLFATAAFLLIVALFFFCVFKYNNSRKAWDVMKMFIMGSAVLMLVAIGLYIHEITIGNVHWENILEPCCLFFLFTGMFLTCEYVEEIPIFLEPDKYQLQEEKEKKSSREEN